MCGCALASVAAGTAPSRSCRGRRRGLMHVPWEARGCVLLLPYVFFAGVAEFVDLRAPPPRPFPLGPPCAWCFWCLAGPCPLAGSGCSVRRAAAGSRACPRPGLFGGPRFFSWLRLRGRRPGPRACAPRGLALASARPFRLCAWPSGVGWGGLWRVSRLPCAFLSLGVIDRWRSRRRSMISAVICFQQAQVSSGPVQLLVISPWNLCAQSPNACPKHA